MKKLAMFVGLIALAAPSLFITPAQAQATRTWISGVGDDVNPCSRTAPCKTFPGAISKTAPGGEIDTLDPGGFGAVTVTKAITLANEGIGSAGILVAGTNGVTVNAGAGDVVILRGLQIDGGPVGSNSLAGVKFIAGKALEIQNCTIRNFTGGSPNGYGVSFTPVGAGELDITDTTITTNGQIGGGATIGGGVFIQPTGTPAVKVVMTRDVILNNTNGIRIDTSAATGGQIRATINNTVIQNSGFHGLAVNVGATGTTNVVVAFDQSQSVNNSGNGVVSNGATSNVILNNSVVTGNGIKGVDSANSGVLTSYKNNVIAGNTSDNTGVLTLVSGQ
ncbi:MAG TPA: hypothetical protein VHU87_10820 [Rhizomicrobium sp.]|jgi:hypothetical protein|nr:hypothetical protein [Rhizomicrobium sp.]